jgi:hypothetical protein
MADLMVNRNNRLSMSGESSVKSASKQAYVGLRMLFGGKSQISSNVKTVITIVIESVSIIIIETDYISKTTNSCIGTSIQTHGPPMVEKEMCLHSVTVFTVYLILAHLLQLNSFLKYTCRCGHSVDRTRRY